MHLIMVIIGNRLRKRAQMMRSDKEQVNQKLGEGSEDVFYEFGEVLEESA